MSKKQLLVVRIDDIKGHEGAAENFAVWMKNEFPEGIIVVNGIEIDFVKNTETQLFEIKK